MSHRLVPGFGILNKCFKGRQWLTQDTDACYVNSNGHFVSCTCPLSTCTQIKGSEFVCRFSFEVTVFGIILLILIFILTYLYLSASYRADTLALYIQRHTGPTIIEQVWSKLFGETEQRAETDPLLQQT